MPDDALEPARRSTISRRAFLAGGAVAGGLVLVGVSRPWFSDADDDHQPDGEVGSFLTAAERVTVDAIVARLIPGSPEDPGAREAGAVEYIDRKLAAEGFAEPTYLAGPLVEVVSSPAAASAGTLTVAESELYRYGYQSGNLPQTVYRSGLVALDVFCGAAFGAAFAELSDEDQNAALRALDDIQQASEGSGSSEGQNAQSGGAGDGSDGGGAMSTTSQRSAAEAAFNGDVGAGEFFSTVHTDTIEGMFSDPSYGGNRDLVGWTLIGFPGPQRSYSPAEMLVGARRRPQPHDELPHMNPDRPDHRVPEALEQPRQGVKDG